MAKNTINLYITLSILNRVATSWFMATYAIFLLGHGLNFFQINMVNTVFFVTMLFLEIPTGALADIIGRKRTFVIACCVHVLAMLIYAFSKSFWGFAIAETLAGIALALESGTFQAWLIGELNGAGHKVSKVHIFARSNSISIVLAAIAVFIGAKMAVINPAFPWFLGSATFALSGTIAYFKMKENYFVYTKRTVRERLAEFKEKIVGGFQLARSSQAVLFIFIVAIVQYIAVQAPNMQWQPYMKGVLHAKDVGWLGFCIPLTIGLGARLAPKLLSKIKDERFLLTLTQAMAGCFIVLAVVLSGVPLIVTAFLIHEVWRGMYDPVRDQYLHDNITDESKRATVASFAATSRHIGAIIGLVISGLIATYLSIPLAWIISGSFMAVGTIVIYLTIRRK